MFRKRDNKSQKKGASIIGVVAVPGTGGLSCMNYVQASQAGKLIGRK